MRTRPLLAAALVVGALAPAAGAASASLGRPAAAESAGLGIRLLDAPTDRRHDPRAQTYIVDHLAPGSTIQRRVQLSDNTNGPLTASLYVGGATVKDGTFTPGDKGVPSDLATWSSVNPTSVALSAGKTAAALVRITVPQDAASGERYGVIWAELPPSPGSGVKTINRVGVRIYLSIGAGGEPESDFTIDSLQASRRADGLPVVTAKVHNTGGRALDMSGGLSLTGGPGGLSAGPFPATLGTSLAVGETEPVTVALDKAITGGPWTAVITMKSGLLERKAQGRLTFPDTAGQIAPEVRAKAVPLLKDTNRVGIFAASLIGVVALLLLALALNGLRGRKRPRGPELNAAG